jgi:hypothetical protein
MYIQKRLNAGPKCNHQNEFSSFFPPDEFIPGLLVPPWFIRFLNHRKGGGGQKAGKERNISST